MTYKEIKDKTPYEILDLLEMKEPPLAHEFGYLTNDILPI